MDPLVFDSHQDRPERMVPVDGHRQRQGPDRFVNAGAHGVAVGFDLAQPRPVVMGRVKVVPGHLVNANGEHRLEPGIDPLVRDPGDDQLVDVEGRRMSEVENQRVPERLGPQVERVLRGERLVEPLVQAVGGVEILADLFTLLVRIILVQDGSSRISRIHKVLRIATSPQNRRHLAKPLVSPEWLSPRGGASQRPKHSGEYQPVQRIADSTIVLGTRAAPTTSTSTRWFLANWTNPSRYSFSVTPPSDNTRMIGLGSRVGWPLAPNCYSAVL